jgi:tetratricopeptide (TPR) repeat protein
MEQLDLSCHDPEKYEGKLVIWRECEYVVGACLGSRTERINHKLINRVSGLCLHVLKIWRQPNLGYVPSQIRARLAAGTRGVDFAKVIPVSIEIELPGGRAEMQIHEASSEDLTTAADALTQTGDELLDNLKIRQAIQAYEQALTENPNHTHALVNLAAAHSQLNDLATAYELAAKARSIEPNYPLYHRACIQYLTSQGFGRLALNEFHLTHEYFPNVFDFNDIGAELLVACGHPESAQALAEECLLDSADKKVMIEKIHAAVEAKFRARVLMDEARSMIAYAEPHRVAALLEKARAIDRNNPLLATNLGLTFGRVGRYCDATPLLEYAARYGPLEWAKACYANAAFCAMEQGKLEAGMILLDLTMSQLDAELRGQEPENLVDDLPGRGIWLDDRNIVEEPLDSAAELVIRSVRKYAKQSTIPENASRLAKLYAKTRSLHAS